MPQPKNVENFGGSLRWAIRYLVDWRPLGKDVNPYYLHATILRWFHHPATRGAALTRATAYYEGYDLTLPEPVQTTILELEQVNIRIGPAYDASRFAGFLYRLGDGDLVNGGPFDDDLPKDWAKWRPAFPWLLSKWRKEFPPNTFPWPYFIFPGPHHPSPGAP